MNHGNQYVSRKRALMSNLLWARTYLSYGAVHWAQAELRSFRAMYALVPASTRRRWKCGR